MSHTRVGTYQWYLNGSGGVSARAVVPIYYIFVVTNRQHTQKQFVIYFIPDIGMSKVAPVLYW